MNTPENTRYWETAEYNTTVEAAQKAAGLVTPADCLAYELEQYVAVCSKHFHYSDDSQGGRPERLSANHPDYPRRLAECRESAEQQLARAYELREQELADEWAAAHERNPPDERLRLALQLKESAHRLLDGYADYLVLVGVGRLVLTSTVPSFLVRGTAYPKDAAARLRHVRERVEKAMYGYIYDAGPYSGLDRGLIVGAAGAAELAHFYRLLAAFQAAEQVPTAATVPAGAAAPAQLTLPQLALFHILSGKHINDEAHANQLATTVGRTSGERLLKCFNKWRKTSDRTCIEGRAKLRPFIKNMEAVIPHLTERDKKEAAESELEGLKRNLAASLD